MAKVYDRVKGEPLERIVARHKDTQDALRTAAYQTGERAEANLAAAQTHDPNVNQRAYVDVVRDEERPDIDYLVRLNDDRGYAGAMSIEYGREGGRTDSIGRKVAPMKPLWILHRAAGLAEEEG